MKNQALFTLKDKSKKLKCRLLQFLFGTLRVKQIHVYEAVLPQKQILSFERRPSFGRTVLSREANRKSKKFVSFNKNA